jgi:Cdc6-like AAA superfamily ATPase
MSSSGTKPPEGNRAPADLSKVSHAIRNLFIRLPQVKRVTDRAEQLYLHRCNSEEPEHLMVLGESGVGKSRLLVKFAESKPPVQHQHFREIPVLYVEVPVACTIKKLATEMLKALGSPFWNRGTEQDRTHQVLTLLPECRVRLVILDEVNHLLDRGQYTTHYAVGDWIKQLSDKARVSFILAGTPVVEELRRTNEQLRGRFGEVMELPPLSLTTADDQTTFKGALNVFQQLLAEVDSVSLTSPAMVKSFAYATGGRLRALRAVLVGALEIAAKQPSQALTIETLQQAFRDKIYRNAQASRNPFCQQFDNQPLTGPGEPYAPARKRSTP